MQFANWATGVIENKMVLFPGSLCRSKQIHTLARWHVLASTWSASLVMNFGSEHAHTLTNTANAAIWCTFVSESFLENWILSKFVESLKLDPIDQCRGRLIHPEFWRLRCTGYVVPLQCSFLLLATSNWFDLVCLWILRKLKPNGWPKTDASKRGCVPWQSSKETIYADPLWLDIFQDLFWHQRVLWVVSGWADVLWPRAGDAPTSQAQYKHLWLVLTTGQRWLDLNIWKCRSKSILPMASPRHHPVFNAFSSLQNVFFCQAFPM